MEDGSRSSWISWATVVGTLAICCGAPFIALAVAVGGGTAAILTGALWIAVGAGILAAAIGTVHVLRRRSLGRRAFAELREAPQPGKSSQETHDRD